MNLISIYQITYNKIQILFKYWKINLNLDFYTEQIKLKIIIIGSGIGGSGIGALLSQEKNMEISLFEQNTILGGRCASYNKEDDQGRLWRMDIGCHIISNCEKGPLGEIADICGQKIEWSHTVNPGPRINLMGNWISYSGQRKKSKKKKDKPDKKKRPAPGKEIMQKFMAMSDSEIKKLDEVPLFNFLDQVIPEKARYQMTKIMYMMQGGVMFGLAPDVTSAGEFVRCVRLNGMNRSMGYPIGGCGAIPEAYCRAIEASGGKILTGEEGTVKKIIIEDEKATGIEAGPDNKFYPADVVISNADIKTTILKLAGEKYFENKYAKRIESLTWGGQVCSQKIALDTIITDQKMITYVPPMDMRMFQDLRGNIDSSAAGSQKLEVPEKSALLIVPVSNHDPKLAPESCQNIHTVTTTLGVANLTMAEREANSKKWEKTCLNSLLTLWPEVEDHIVFTDFVSDVFLEKRMGKEGAGTGIGQTIDQVGDKRPKQKTPIAGLYLSSCDAGGWGIGTELGAMSALELYDILKQDKII